MKKLLGSLLAVVLAAGLLAGCGNSSAETTTEAPATTTAAQTTTAAAESEEDTQAEETTEEETEPEAKTFDVDAYTFRANCGAVEGEELYSLFVYFKDALEEASNGAMTFSIYADNGYRDSVALDDILNDNVDIVYLSSSSSCTTVTDLAYMATYGAFNYVDGYDDTQSLLSFYDATADLVDSIFNDYNMHFLNFRNPGYAVIASKGVLVKTPSDLNGKLLRVAGNWPGKLCEIQGIATATVKITEIATAIQRGTVDAALSGDAQCRDLMFYEVSDYITVFPEADQVGSLVINLNTYNSLSKEQQECLDYAAYQAMKTAVSDRAKVYEECRDLFESGCEVYMLTEEECEEWTSAIPALYEAIDETTTEKGKALRDAIIKWREDNDL